MARSTALLLLLFVKASCLQQHATQPNKLIEGEPLIY